MSKKCLNCGREISGEGRNKIFCDDCYKTISLFLREVQSSNEPAMKVFDRNHAHFYEAGISIEAERYIEKCCRRYDEKKGYAAPAAPQEPKPANADEGINDVSGIVSDPFGPRTAHTEGASGDPSQEYISMPDPFSMPRPRHRVQSTGQAERPAAAADQASAGTAPQRKAPEGEKSPDGPETIMFAPVQPRRPAAGGSGGSGNGGSSFGYNPADDDDNDDNDGNNGGGGGDDGEKRKLIIICIAAVTVVILFIALALNGVFGSAGKRPSGDVTDGKTNNYRPSDSDNRPSDSDSGTTGGDETTGDPIATTHVHNWVEATCTEPRKCSGCGETEGDPLGHNYGDGSCDEPATCQRCGESSGVLGSHVWAVPTFTWSADNSKATATFKCTRNSAHTDTVTANVTSESTEATCDDAGQTKYTATVTHDGATYTDERTGNASPAKGHAWTAVFTWSEDGASCSVKFTCSNDSSHTQTLTATVSGATRVKEPSCTEEGIDRVTASVTLDGKEYTENRDTAVPALGHDFKEGELYCSRCGEPRAPFRTVGAEYKDPNSDLWVTVSSIDHRYVAETDQIIFTVKIFLENKAAEDAYEEGSFRMYFESGRYVTADYVDNNAQTEIWAGDVREHELTFTVDAGETPLLLEYRSSNYSGYGMTSQYFSEEPGAALYWKIEG